MRRSKREPVTPHHGVRHRHGQRRAHPVAELCSREALRQAPGWEEGLFPHQKSLEEKGDFALEEERRLAYVGITRAKKEAYISFAMRRSYHGDWMDSLPSRFVNELPDSSIEKNENNNKLEDEDFDFNQDLTVEYDQEYRSPGWERFKNKKLLKWKKLKN